MDRDLTLDEVMEQWGALRQSILALGETTAEVLVPVFQRIMDTVRAFVIQLQRTQLAVSLACHWWIPERFAYWLSDKWPERWLPELRFE